MTATAEATTGAPIELWLEPDQPDPFAIFDAMRAANVRDVRRVGVLCPTTAHIAAARAAGAGAVVGVGRPTELAAAAPDVVSEREDLDSVLKSVWGPDGA